MAGLLACPVCQGALERSERVLRCPAGHAFDIARQGYVNLSRSGAARGDDAAMVAARAGFLDGGWFDPLTAAHREAVADAVPGAVVDIGAGTGHHLAAAVGDRTGVAIDASAYAARRAARAHPRVSAVVADAWRRLPLRDGCAAVVMVVFAPRAGAEIARLLAPGGKLLVVTPAHGHLAELATPLGLLAVDPRKEQRLHGTLEPELQRVDSRELEWTMHLDRRAALALAAMGPSARHTDPEALRGRVETLPEPIATTAAVTVSSWQVP